MPFARSPNLALLRDDVEMVFELDSQSLRLRINDPVHCPVQTVFLYRKLYVVIVGEQNALIKVLGRPLDEIGWRAAAAGDQIRNPIDHIAFVIVDVPGADQKTRVSRPRSL